MNDPIIKVEGLGKKYIISHEGKESYTSLRDVISRNTKKLVKTKEKANSSREEFWALKDVSFEVKKGEAVGIIGRNGAGKSTLLKILSRITEPTHGHIEMSGRVASLLEVGTGFHPELTGRENIFLNGAILGMSRVEIKRKFDEIVDFSGVEKFLDTPVKRYSSGMYVRLAFAVAAHLEPEILVVDEVLAVGDAEFQKKCLGKMNDVSKKEGRTVLFVSHNMQAIQRLCTKGVLLKQGTVFGFDKIENVVSLYNEMFSFSGTGFRANSDNKKMFAAQFSFLDKEKRTGKVHSGDDCYFKIDVQSNFDISNVHIGFGIDDYAGNRIFTLYTKYFGKYYNIRKGENIISCFVPSLKLKPGTYTILISIASEFENFDYNENGTTIEISLPINDYEMYPDNTQGSIIIDHQWI